MYNISKSKGIKLLENSALCFVNIKWLILWTSLDISIGTVMKNSEMMKFVLDHLKNKIKNV